MKRIGAMTAGRSGETRRRSLALVAALAFLLATVAWADNRTLLEPGWNMFSPQQDVDVGQQVSIEAEQQLRMLGDSRVDDYVNALGQTLSSYAPGEPFPYSFKVVDDGAINAFALPGGPVYINRGVIAAADNEAQLAGVIAHEIAHVALRHGTNQASKASAAQLPLAILGGLLGSDSTEAALAQLGANFAVSSVLLKYSRTAESQADIMGTQILFDAGYDPRAMAQFFQKLGSLSDGSGPVEFFSNHPSPVTRIDRVNQEVVSLGAAPGNAGAGSRTFDDTRRYLQSLAGDEGQRPQTSSQGAASDLLIVSARYGAGNRFIDVRDRIQARVDDARLDLKVSNSSMGGDPISRSKALEMR
jgi:predicted Zn-dependent protease